MDIFFSSLSRSAFSLSKPHQIPFRSGEKIWLEHFPPLVLFPQSTIFFVRPTISTPSTLPNIPLIFLFPPRRFRGLYASFPSVLSLDSFVFGVWLPFAASLPSLGFDYLPKFFFWTPGRENALCFLFFFVCVTRFFFLPALSLHFSSTGYLSDVRRRFTWL